MPVQIKIKIHYRERDTDQYDQETFEVLTFDSLVPVTASDAKAKSFGRWSSPSKFIGYHSGGQYYVTNIHPTDEEQWALDGPVPGVNTLNPVAFFFDERWTDPFMVLYGLAPMQLDLGEKGKAEGKSPAGSRGLLRGVAGHFKVDHHVTWRPKT